MAYLQTLSLFLIGVALVWLTLLDYFDKE